MVESFRTFYEGLLAMVSEGVPAPFIVDRIRRALPDPASRKSLLGHLRDSRNALEAEGKNQAAETLDQVIKTVESSDR